MSHSLHLMYKDTSVFHMFSPSHPFPRSAAAGFLNPLMIDPFYFFVAELV